MSTEAPGQAPKLDAVFWDYPQFQDPDVVRETIDNAENESLRRWFLTRFLEYGRVVDTFRFFPSTTSANNFPTSNSGPTRGRNGNV
jgi:hypothetical protein